MKKFITKITLLLTLFAVFNMVFLFIIPKDKNNYLCAYNQKIHLLEAIPQPRMIFIGGSNIAFGIDSKVIGDSLNYHVINFGLHGGIGIRYPLEDVLQYIRKGDIVVLQFEYGNFSGGDNGERETFPQFMVATNWRNAEKLNVEQWINVICGIPDFSFKSMVRLAKFPIRGSLDSPTENAKFAYIASGFNKYGDEISHLNYPDEKYKPTKKNNEKEIKVEFMNWLNETIERYEQAGATVVMLPPVCIQSYFHAQYNHHIEDALKAINHPYVVSPSSMALDDSYMFNTGYHINREGRQQNTQNIIRSLYFLKN